MWLMLLACGAPPPAEPGAPVATDTGPEAPVPDEPLPEIPELRGELAARPFEWGWPGDQPYQLPYDYDAKIMGDSAGDHLGVIVILGDRILTRTSARDRAYLVDPEARGDVSLAQASQGALTLPAEVTWFAPCGDVNADGRTDLAINGDNPDNSANDARLLFWSPEGTELARAFFPTPARPACAGDLTGDGTDDMFVNDWEHAWLWHGPLPERPAWDDAATVVTGLDGSPWFSGGGDLDGDGRDELIWIQNGERESTACVAAEPPAGSIALPDLSSRDLPCIAYVPENEDTSSWIWTTSTDLDEDGYADLILDVPDWNTRGGVFAFTSPLPVRAEVTEAPTQFLGAGHDSPGQFGSSSAVGDLDGDGTTDIAIADYYAYWRGTVSIFRAPGEGVHLATDADITFASPEERGLGFGLHAIVDVDADGRDDLLIGDLADDENGVDAGAIYLFLGANLF